MSARAVGSPQLQLELNLRKAGEILGPSPAADDDAEFNALKAPAFIDEDAQPLTDWQRNDPRTGHWQGALP